MAKSSMFCDKMTAELGYPFTACATAEDAVRNADVVFTQTTGGAWVLEEKWLRPHALIIASGSDQPTKNELPPAVLKKAGTRSKHSPCLPSKIQPSVKCNPSVNQTSSCIQTTSSFWRNTLSNLFFVTFIEPQGASHGGLIFRK
jgi:ornithine carbamoyltransferase